MPKLIPNRGIEPPDREVEFKNAQSLEEMIQILHQTPDETFLRYRELDDWTPELLCISHKEDMTFLEGWRWIELGWSRERLTKATHVPMAVIEAWEAPNPEPWLLDQAAESLGLPRWLMDRTEDDYPWLTTI